MGVQVASLFGVLSLRDEMTPALNSALAGINSVGAGLTNLAGQIAPFSAIAAAGLGASVNAAMNFDAAMTNAGAILGQNAEQMQVLNAQVQQLGANSLVGPQAAAEAFYSIVSGVQDATTHMAILEAAIATSEAGGADLTTTTSGLIAVMNAYGLGADDAARISDVFSRTVQMGVGTMDEFVAAINPLASLGNTLGIGVEDIGAQLAYMTTQGLTASTAMTAMQGAMTAFINPNTAMTDALQLMGYETGAQAVQALGLSGALQALSEATGGSEQAMAAALGRVEALRAGLILGGEGANEFLLAYEQGIDGATEAARELQRQSLQAHMQSLRSAVTGVAIEIGQLLTPMLITLAEKAHTVVSAVMEWIQLNPDLARQIAMVAGAVAIAAPILFSVGTALQFIGFAVGGLLSPIGLIIGAVTALGYAWSINFMGIRDIVIPIINDIKSAIQVLLTGDFVGGMFNGASEDSAIVDFWFNVRDNLLLLFSNIGATVRRIFDAVSPFVTEFAEFLGNIFERVDIGQIVQIGMTLWSLTNPIGWLMTGLRALGVDFMAVFEGVMSGLTTFFSVLNDGGTVTDALVAVFGDSVVPILDTVSSVINNVLIPAWNSFVGFVVGAWELIQPALMMIGNWFINDVLPQIVNHIQNFLIPIIVSFINFLAQAWAIVAPSLENLARWFLEDALPAILSFISGTVMPAIAKFSNALLVIWETVSPFLLQMLDWFINTGLPLAVQFFEETLIPIIDDFITLLETIWDVISPALTSMVDWFTTTGLPIIVDYINEHTIPAIQDFIGILQTIWDLVRPHIHLLRDGIGLVFNWLSTQINGFIQIIDGIVSAVETAVDAVNELTGIDLGDIVGGGGGGSFDIGGAVADVGGFVSNPFQTITNAIGGTLGGLLGFADGGYTGNAPADQPTGFVHGQEYVVPKDGALVMSGGGGDTYNVTINASPGADGAMLARDFETELKRLKRANG